MWGEMNVESEKETSGTQPLGWSLMMPTHPFQGDSSQILIDAQHDALFFTFPKRNMEFQAQIILYQEASSQRTGWEE